MSPFRKRMTTMPGRYDQALQYCHDKNLPPGTPQPKYTRDWPPENVALLERYAEWLLSGGYSENVIRTIYIPMAGHVLGLALKPYSQLDLKTDLSPALEYVKAKGAGPDWSDFCRVSLEKFRRFLMHTRGQIEIKVKPYESAPHTQGLPDWLVTELDRYQHVCQRNWRTARLEDNIRRFWSGHLRVWRFLCDQRGVKELSDVHRNHLYEYADYRLEVGNSVTTVNADLRTFRSFMIFLQEQEFSVPLALLRIHGLKQPDSLPKYLTDVQVRGLRDDFEDQVARAKTSPQRRDALIIRAAFYLYWQCGLRKSEVEELRLEDLDLAGRKLSVRNGKGLKDRTVYLTDTTVSVLSSYLVMRGIGPTDHVFLYRNQPLGKDLIRGRLKAAGERIGVHVHAHRLRHTCATQLLNAGCRITSIQKFLGHKRLNTTMVYARVYDQTMADDYYAAMSRIEQRLQLVTEQEEFTNEPISESERSDLLTLTDQLAEPELNFDLRFEIVNKIRGLLNGSLPVSKESVVETGEKSEWIPPPQFSVFIDAEAI
jgi:site-specific recombinase XerD